MEFEEFKDMDQVKANPKENEENGGIIVKRKESIKAQIFQMNNKSKILKAKV